MQNRLSKQQLTKLLEVSCFEQNPGLTRVYGCDEEGEFLFKETFDLRRFTVLRGARELVDYVESLEAENRNKLCMHVIMSVTMTLSQLHKKGLYFGKSLAENIVVLVPIREERFSIDKMDVNELSSDDEEEELYEYSEGVKVMLDGLDLQLERNFHDLKCSRHGDKAQFEDLLKAPEFLLGYEAPEPSAQALIAADVFALGALAFLLLCKE